MNESKTHVAVVDDDESFSRALGRILRVSGFEVVVYTNPEAFISDTSNARMDCVVLDIELGSMSGLELRRRMLALRWAAPVVFVTAHDELEIRRKAEEIGCAAYLRKPVRGQSLIEAIHKAVIPAHQFNSGN